MAYTPPRMRSCAVLNGQQFYPKEGSVLDISQFRRTPAVANVRLVQVGDKIYAANDLTRPIKLVGNNTSVNKQNPLDPAKFDQIVAKYKARGVNFLRFHHIEAYLMMGGPLYQTDTGRVGTRNYDPDRWAELDLFIYKCKMAGIYVSFGIASSNMALNTRGLDRYDSTLNTTGSVTLTVEAGTGKILTATRATTNSNPYPDPPSVVVSDIAGSSGYGAEIQAQIDANGALLPNLIVVKPGQGYSQSATAALYGGTGRALYRIWFDNTIRQHWKDVTCTDFLGHVNPYTGLTYAQDPVVFMIEHINEANLATRYANYGSNSVPSQIRPRFVEHLAARFGTPANMNAALGTSVAGFWDAAAFPKAPGQTPDGTQPSRKFYWESQKFTSDTDVELYSWMSAQIRATGFAGVIASRDLIGEPNIARLYTETGANMQGFHAYPSLIDSTAPGTSYLSSLQAANAPAYYAFGDNQFFACLGNLTADVPWMLTELGYPWPGRYRAEYGLLLGGYGCTHNCTGVAYHGDYPIGLVFGTSNTSGSKALRQHGYEHDPNGNVSTWLGNLILQRGDVTELPVTKTLVLNRRALYNVPDVSQIAGLTYQFYSAMIGPAAAYQVTQTVGRQVTKWDTVNPDDNAIGTAWVNDVFRSSVPSQLADHGLAAADATNWWINTQGNQTITNNTDKSATAMRYTKRTTQSGNRSEVFADRVAGLLGINSPRTQALVASGAYAQAAATVVRAGSSFTANTTRTNTASSGYSYIKNAKGDLFFDDLSVDFIEDGTLFAVTSASMAPLTTADRIIVVACSNYYNSGQTFQSGGQRLTGLTLNGGTGYANITEWGLSGNGGSASVLVYSVSGVPTTYKIVDQKGTFTGNPTSFTQVGSGGAGLTFNGFTFTPDAESREVTFLTASNGVNEGWPIMQQRFVVEATLRNVDLGAVWVLYELNFAGERIAEVQRGVRRAKKGLKIRIDSSRTRETSSFFELVKVA